LLSACGSSGEVTGSDSGAATLEPSKGGVAPAPGGTDAGAGAGDPAAGYADGGTPASPTAADVLACNTDEDQASQDDCFANAVLKVLEVKQVMLDISHVGAGPAPVSAVDWITAHQPPHSATTKVDFGARDGGGGAKALVTVMVVDTNDDGTMSFDFTLDGDQIVETGPLVVNGTG
jgi:hypothetical protein